MITAVNRCGCAPKLSVPQDCLPPSSASSCPNSPPCTPISNRPSSSLSRPRSARRKPFENPPLKLSKEDEANCSCPRDGEPKYTSMHGKCSPCCAGVFTENKVVSKIVQGGKPYKEIEAVINDNRMVIRIQREPLKSEWDPPCDCADDNLGSGQREIRLGGGGCEPVVQRGCGNDVVFQKADNSSGSQGGCRTVTVFPQPEILPPSSVDNETKEKDKCEKTRTPRPEDIEENPNIFLLRIRKRTENHDRKNYIDLEFRTPRPWMNRPKPKVPLKTPTPPKPVVEKKSPKGKGAGKKKKGKK